MRLRFTASLTACLYAVGCTSARVEPVSMEPVEVEPRNPERNRYEAALLKASGPDPQALADWQAAGKRSLRERLEIEPSFREVVRFNGHDAYAVGYRIELRRDERLHVELRRRSGSGQLFVEVFEEIPPQEDPFYRLAYSPPATRRFVFKAAADGAHVLRLQPELGASNEWEVMIRTDGGVQFPVENGTRESVRSVFGDPRDGGARDHKGIDIFAPRGTSVVAVADGRVTNVESTAVGGKVVWLRDDARDVLYYYAHLDQQLVRRGRTVRAGEPIGTVGNTGNARRSSPHLHFGIYGQRNRALDPLPFLYRASPGPGPVLADVSSLGRWLTVDRDAIQLRAAPSTEGRVIHEITRDSRVLVVGAVRGWHRVRLEDGRSGFIAGFLLRS